MQTDRIRMLRRSGARIAADDFVIEPFDLPALADGDVLTQTRWFSLDPYLASRMRTWSGPERGWSEGIVGGRTVSEVVESRDPAFKPGDCVIGIGGWQHADVRAGKNLQRVDAAEVPLQSYLGVLGSSGLTAWVGVNRILRPQGSETAVVSSAGGMVGSLVGQLLKAQNCRVIGIAGGEGKCRSVVASGFDVCVDHTTDDFSAALATATEGGIDLYFENVGAKTLDAALASMREYGRIALCGLIAHYQDDNPFVLKSFREILYRAITLQGFRVSDYATDFQNASNELGSLLKVGKLNVRETVTAGLERAPQAYVDMLAGAGIGKHLVCLD